MKSLILLFNLLFLTMNGQSNTKAALLLIDIQNDYFPGGKMELCNSTAAAQNAAKLLKTFRDWALPVCHVQHLSTRPDAAFFIPETTGAEINSAVKPLAGEKIIIKHYPNSFRETELFQHLKNEKIQTLVIAGMMSHMCVDATARAAKDLGFNVVIISDVCATKDLETGGARVTAENVQTAFMAALSYYYASIISTGDYMSSFNLKENKVQKTYDH